MSGTLEPQAFPAPIRSSGAGRPTLALRDWRRSPGSFESKGVREVSFRIAFPEDLAERLRFVRWRPGSSRPEAAMASAGRAGRPARRPAGAWLASCRPSVATEAPGTNTRSSVWTVRGQTQRSGNRGGARLSCSGHARMGHRRRYRHGRLRRSRRRCFSRGSSASAACGRPSKPSRPKAFLSGPAERVDEDGSGQSRTLGTRMTAES